MHDAFGPRTKWKIKKFSHWNLESKVIDFYYISLHGMHYPNNMAMVIMLIDLKIIYEKINYNYKSSVSISLKCSRELTTFFKMTGQMRHASTRLMQVELHYTLRCSKQCLHFAITCYTNIELPPRSCLNGDWWDSKGMGLSPLTVFQDYTVFVESVLYLGFNLLCGISSTLKKQLI